MGRHGLIIGLKSTSSMNHPTGIGLPSITLTMVDVGGERGKFKTGLLEQGPEFRLGPFESTWEGHHRHIEIVGNGSAIAVGNDTFHDDQSAMRGNHVAAMAQDLNTVLIGPIVNDVAEQIGIRPRRYDFKETALDHLATVGEPILPQAFACARRHMPRVEQHTPHRCAGHWRTACDRTRH
jgi:hypothetical protein